MDFWGGVVILAVVVGLLVVIAGRGHDFTRY